MLRAAIICKNPRQKLEEIMRILVPSSVRIYQEDEGFVMRNESFIFYVVPCNKIRNFIRGRHFNYIKLDCKVSNKDYREFIYPIQSQVIVSGWENLEDDK